MKFELKSQDVIRLLTAIVVIVGLLSLGGLVYGLSAKLAYDDLRLLVALLVVGYVPFGVGCVIVARWLSHNVIEAFKHGAGTAVEVGGQVTKHGDQSFTRRAVVTRAAQTMTAEDLNRLLPEPRGMIEMPSSQQIDL